MTHVKPTAGHKDEYYVNKEMATPFKFSDCEEMLGGPIHIWRLLSDEYLVVLKECKEYEKYPVNSLASVLANEPVYGPSITLDSSEVEPHEDWLHKSHRTLSFNRRRDAMCKGKGIDITGRKARTA